MICVVVVEFIAHEGIPGSARKPECAFQPQTVTVAGGVPRLAETSFDDVSVRNRPPPERGSESGFQSQTVLTEFLGGGGLGFDDAVTRTERQVFSRRECDATPQPFVNETGRVSAPAQPTFHEDIRFIP